DAPPVREPSGLEDLDRDVDRPDRIEWGLLADELLERAARQVLHRDVVGAVGRTSRGHADDVRVLEARGRVRLPAEPLDEPRVLGEALIEKLQRALAAELLILGQ